MVKGMQVMKTTKRKYPSAEIITAAGRAAWDWFADTGECHFCTVDSEKHEDWCPLVQPCADSVDGECPVAHEHE